MIEQEKMSKVDRLERKMRQARAEYQKAVREEKEKERKAKDRHKYMMGGCVQKYFPKGLNVYDFNEHEMNRIIACAFSLKDVRNMINTVIKERPNPAAGSVTENFSVRTDIPPEVVSGALPGASCGQLLSAGGSQEGTRCSPSGVRSTPTP